MLPLQWLRRSVQQHSQMAPTEAHVGAPAASAYPYRAIALDLDGTLFNSEHQISAGNVAALRDLSASGVTIAICTGRPTFDIRDAIDRLNLPGRVPCVTFNGALGAYHRANNLNHVPELGVPELGVPEQGVAEQGVAEAGVAEVGGAREHPSSDRTLSLESRGYEPFFSAPLPRTAVETLVRLASTHGLLLQYYIGDRIHVACRTASHYEMVRRDAAFYAGYEPHLVVPDYDEALRLGLPHKLGVMTTTPEVTHLRIELLFCLPARGHI